MRKQAILAAAAFVVVALFLIGPPIDAQTPKRGGTLTVGLLGPITIIDPHKAPNQPAFWLIQLTYSFLVQYDKALVLRPDLAVSWDRPDSRTYVFRLRRGAKFHNGRDVTSADVKYSIERIMDPRTGSSRRLRYASVDRVEAPDPYTVVFRLRYPDNILPYLLADPASAIVAKEVVEKEGDLTRFDAGSGPFILERLTPDGGAILVRYPGYHESGRPYVDRVLLRSIPDNTARITAVRTADIDIATFLVSHQIQLLRRDPKVVVTDGLSGQFYFLALNMRRKPFDDMKVRQAIAWALDRDAIVQGALSGEGFPLSAGPIPAWHWAGIKSPIFKRDVARAKQLLASSSVPNGFSFTIRVWAPQDYVVDAVALIQQQLQPLNIKVGIDQQADFPTYWNPVLQGAFEATIQGYGGNAHPDDWLTERFRTGGASNIAGYSNPKVDDLLQRARVAPTPERQAELYEEVQRIVAQEAAMVFIYNMKQATVHRVDVKGFYHMPILTLAGVKDAWLDR